MDHGKDMMVQCFSSKVLLSFLWSLRIDRGKFIVFCVMVHKGFISFYSRTFPGLSNKIQGVNFLRHSHYLSQILHILNSCANKPIPVSANNILKPKDNSFFRVK